MTEHFSTPELLAKTYWKDSRYDSTSGNLDYKGLNRIANSSGSESNWQIWKFTWSSGNLIRKQGPIEGKWDDRASLGW